MTTIFIPRPPSTNGLYKNVGRRRAKSKMYEKWIRHAGRRLNVQNITPVPGPVNISLYVEKNGKIKEDIDNRIKAAIDILVSHKIIDDDHNVQRVSAEWADVDGCRIVIEQWQELNDD